MLNKKSNKRIKHKRNKFPNKALNNNIKFHKRSSQLLNNCNLSDRIDRNNHLKIVKPKDNKESNRISKNKSSQTLNNKIYK